MALGIEEKISDYAEAANVLANNGYHVALYPCDSDILKQGDPELLGIHSDAVKEHFGNLAANVDETFYFGCSLGASIALHLQRRDKRAKPGLYATAGIRLSRAVFKSEGFRGMDITAAFESSMGVNQGDDAITLEAAEALLQVAWQDYEMDVATPPLANFAGALLVLGKADMAIDYDEALSSMRSWREVGVPIQTLTQPSSGHLATLRTVRNNFGKLFVASQDPETYRTAFGEFELEQWDTCRVV